MQQVANQNTITLRGSAQLVSEFFNYAVNSILYQRGIYPPDMFESRKKYGLNIMVAVNNEGLCQYLSDVIPQIQRWLEEGSLQKLVLVLTSVVTKEVMERWTFDIETSPEAIKGQAASKPEKEIQAEIQALIRQITACMTFLPLLEDACTFDLLVYTPADLTAPVDWVESDPRYIANATDFKIRSFSTKVHKIETLVTYKTEVC